MAAKKKTPPESNTPQTTVTESLTEKLEDKVIDGDQNSEQEQTDLEPDVINNDYGFIRLTKLTKRKSEEDIKQWCSRYGPIVQCTVMESCDGESVTAYVGYCLKTDALKALHGARMQPHIDKVIHTFPLDYHAD